MWMLVAMPVNRCQLISHEIIENAVLQYAVRTRAGESVLEESLQAVKP